MGIGGANGAPPPFGTAHCGERGKKGAGGGGVGVLWGRYGDIMGWRTWGQYGVIMGNGDSVGLWRLYGAIMGNGDTRTLWGVMGTV